MKGGRGWVVIAATTWAVAQPLAVAGGSATESAVLERVGDVYARMKSLQAALTRETSYRQLGLSDPIETGSIYVKRKGMGDVRVRIEIVEPVPRIVVIKDSRFLLFRPRIRQAIEGDLDRKGEGQAPEFLLLNLMLGGAARVRREYETKTLAQETLGDLRTSRLQLTPRGTRAGPVRHLDLWVDDELWLVRRGEITTTNDLVIRIDFHDIRRNMELSDSVFELTLPLDVERLRR